MNQIKIQTVPSFRPTIFRKYTRIGVLMDQNTKRHCYDRIKKLLPSHHVIEVPAGEEHKTLTTCNHIWQQLTDHAFDRHSLLLILGGGVLGDMGGFCAATYKRGIDFLLIPTTLLAQVDASVGGKLGIDFGPFKNHIGVFEQPVYTHIITDFLSTLPQRELRSGFAEVIKHCLIGDRKMWELVRSQPLEGQSWLRLVKHSVGYKNKIVTSDPFEKGVRKVLNFGHTVGHALEGHLLHSDHRLFHGEAIAAGMIIESFVACQKKLITGAELGDIARYILSIFGKIELPLDEEWLSLVQQDKKNRGNTILMALPKKLGKAVWDVPVSEKEIRAATDYYRFL